MSPAHFWLGCICCKVTLQQVRCDIELMVTVCCCLVFACCNHRYAILAHQPAHPMMTEIKANLFQFLSCAWPANLGTLMRKTLPCNSYQPRLRRDCSLKCASVTRSDRCLRLAGRLRNAQKPRWLTSKTSHSRLVEKLALCSSIDLNLRAFGPRRTALLFLGSPSPP